LRNLKILAALFLATHTFTLSAQPVDNVDIRTTTTGFEIQIDFFIPLQVQGTETVKSGDTAEIQLRADNATSPEVADLLSEQSYLSWNQNLDVPIKDILYDGEIKSTPSIVLHFTRNLKYSVKNTPNLRGLVISVEDDQVIVDTAAAPSISVSEKLVEELRADNPRLAYSVSLANEAMLDKNYPRAIQLLTKVVDEGTGEVRKNALEMLGVAREYNGQLAQAKAEYERFLNDYPEGAEAQRVSQRLNSLITASLTPKQRLGSTATDQSAASDWNHQFYGSLGQTYYHDETTPEEGETQLVRSDLYTDLDFVLRSSTDKVDLRTQFIGSYLQDFRTDSQGNEFIPNVLSFEARLTEVGLFGRVGRQSRSSGGVLGRFDGVYLAYDANDTLTFNAVYGYPVNLQDKTTINTDQQFQGISLDINDFFSGWDFNTFYISQTNNDLKDREAVGGEIRFYQQGKSLFSLVDYDLNFDELNIFMLVGSLDITEKTSLNLTADYRKSPLLTTTNAIIGQGVETLAELDGLYNEDELKQLAIDRTADSKSLTLGLTHQFNDELEFIGEVTMSEFGETLASGGVEAQPGTGQEYFYSTQLIANNLILENDIFILGLRYSDTFNSNGYTLNTNWRINSSNNLRINPRLRFDYRESKDTGDTRTIIRPYIRFDYRIKKWLKFEADMGYEWLEQEFTGVTQNTTGYYLSLGYRAQF